MRLLLPVLFAAMLGAFGPAAGAACNEPTGCADLRAMASVEPAAAAASVQLAEIPGEVAMPIASAEPAAATARVAALSDGRPAGALVMRPETVRAGARASTGERGRADQRSSGSEPSSVWLMLFAGLAFAGFVVAKRSRG